MKSLRAIAREIFGLFVDDGNFAAAILAWLLLAWLVVPRWPVLRQWNGILLFSGLALILVQSGVRTARRHWASTIDGHGGGPITRSLVEEGHGDESRQ